MRPRRPFLLFLLLVLPTALPARAQKLDKDDKKFLDDVRPLLLPDEEKSFKGLKDKSDRQEFQKVFWARRDPDLEAPGNEYQSQYDKLRAEADTAYKVAGRPGSQTDCGRLFILLGKPDEVKKEGGSESLGPRAPETWTYRDRPGQTFSGGQAQIAFDRECRLPEGTKLYEQLDRLAAARIVNPNIDYRVGRDGRLTKLADLLPKPSAARALLKEPRQDFPLQSQAMFLKVQDGGTAVLGVVRGESAGLPVEDAGGRKVVKIVVASSAADASGKEAASTERKTTAEVQKDGSFAAAFRINLRPGQYTLKAAVTDEKGAKGSVAESSIDVPDYGTGEMGMATLMVLRDVHDLPGGAADPDAPFAAFQLGSAELVPFGTYSLSKGDAPWFFYQVYGLKPDPARGLAMGDFLQIQEGMSLSLVISILGRPGEPGAKSGATESYSWKSGEAGSLSVTLQNGVVVSKTQTGLPSGGRCSATATLSILKGGTTPVAQAPPQPLETPVAGSAVGPVPFEKYEPGQYKVLLKVTDNVAKKDKVQEISIEVKP